MQIMMDIHSSRRRQLYSALPLYQSQLFYHLELGRLNSLNTFLDTFKQKTTNPERIDFVFQVLEEHNMLQSKYKVDRKNDSKALKYKERGNTLFIVEKYDKALHAYTKMLMKAENKELIAIGYANRSAALFKLKLYKEALTDVDRALDNDYPDRLKPKLMERKRKSLELLSRVRILNYFEEIPKILPHLRNSSYPCASNSLEVKTGRKFKSVVATKDIQIGEVISVESAFLAVPNQAYLYHCHDCLILTYNPIPCDGCTQALYCSDKCKDAAFAKYHRHECKILLSIKKLLGNNAELLLAFEMILSEGNGSVPEEISGLIGALDEKDSPGHPVEFVLAAATMIFLLKNYTEKFDSENDGFFKEFIIPYMQLCLLKSSSVDEMYPSENENYVLKGMDSIALALYPFYSLFRHSCAPNVIARQYGLERVARAVKTIKAGEECLVSLGPQFSDESRKIRQNYIFNQYRFKCTCKACTYDWPSYEPLVYFPILTSQLPQVCLLESTNVELAKKTMIKCIEKIRELEQFEPRADLDFYQKVYFYCLDILGNKRFIK